jgi:putative tricarboxylic transport membrane protein
MLYTSAIVSAIIILVFEVIGMPIFPALLKCTYHFLYPAIIIICILGSYISGGSLFSVGVALATCALGVFFGYFGIPQMPFILSFILCSLLEKNFRSGMNMASNGLMSFFTKPFSCIFIILGTCALLWNVIGPMIQEKRAAKKAA